MISRAMKKKHLQVPDLLALFDDLRRKEQIDQNIAELLAAEYI
jgi:hypothetical protein